MSEGAPVPDSGHRISPNSRGRAARLLTALLLAVAAAVVLARGGRLLVHGVALDAQDEERWYGWAWRRPGIAALCERVAEQLAPGERVVLRTPAAGWPDPFWMGVMARYHLADQQVVEVRQGRPGTPTPPGAVVVRMLRNDRFRIRRPDAPAGAPPAAPR